MDPGLRADWTQFRPSRQDSWCPICGQTQTPMRKFCGICTFHIDSAILRVCRSLLIESSKASEVEDDKDSKEKTGKPPREVSLSYVAGNFPLQFSRLIGRHADSLRKSGSWFAHVIAFQYIVTEEFGYDIDTPDDVFNHHMFAQIREMAYQAIYEIGAAPASIFDSKNKQKYTPPEVEGEIDQRSAISSLETLISFYNCKEGMEGGARQTLHDMIADLEKRKKLQIDRGGGTCQQCGASIPEGITVCQQCSDSEQAMQRLSISWKKGLQGPKPAAAPKAPPSRMHIKSDS